MYCNMNFDEALYSDFTLGKMIEIWAKFPGEHISHSVAVAVQLSTVSLGIVVGTFIVLCTSGDFYVL